MGCYNVFFHPEMEQIVVHRREICRPDVFVQVRKEGWIKEDKRTKLRGKEDSASLWFPSIQWIRKSDVAQLLDTKGFVKLSYSIPLRLTTYSINEV